MGCDYYIQKVLRIYFNDEFLSFEVDRERGYFNYMSDEDDETKMDEYIKHVLTPKTEPIIIYNNGFNKPTSEKKYKSIIERLLNDSGKSWSEITKIIKIEVRYERN